MCREVDVPVPATPEDTGNARRATLLTRATSSNLLPTRVAYFTRTPVFVNTGRNIPGPLVSVFKVSYYVADSTHNLGLLHKKRREGSSS